LAQQLESLCSYQAAEPAHAGDVAARPVQTRNEATLDRIITGSEDNRYRRCRGLGGKRRAAVRYDHRHGQMDQVCHKSG
jgi:hypothetical protein